MTCLSENTTKIYNIKSYILTALYNAKSTHSNHTAAVFNHHELGNSKKNKNKKYSKYKDSKKPAGLFDYENQRTDIDFDKLEKELIARKKFNSDN